MSARPTVPNATTGAVFVDPSGARPRVVRRIGLAIAILALGYGITLVTLSLLGIRVDAPRLPYFAAISRLDQLSRSDVATTGTGLGSSTHADSGPADSRYVGSAPATKQSAQARDRMTDTAVDVTATTQRSRMANTSAQPRRTHVGSGAVPRASAEGSPSTQALGSPAVAAPSNLSTHNLARQLAKTDSQQATSDRGKSALAPGADHRSDHASQGRSATAPGADRRATHQAHGKSATAPGAAHRSTHT